MNKITYLVTGSFGFIGSHVIIELLKNPNAIIINIDNLSIGSDPKNVPISERLINYYINICDESIFEIFESHRPDYIIHLAAESHVDRSISNPLSFVESNVNGTANILEGMRRFVPNARMVHVSTDEVYGHLEIDDEPFTEETPIDARSPYSASKAASDMLALSYRNTYKLDITVTRCCNNYGEHQHDEKLIPTIIRSIVSGNRIPVYGKGDNIREWVYVKDHAKAVLEVLHHFSRRRIYNLYGIERYRNLDLIKKIIDELVEIYPIYKRDSYEDYITFVEDRKGHDFKYAMSSIHDEITALHRQESFTTAITKTINYYLSKYA